MTNSKTTKKALLSSVVALLLCFTMLLGTTFAWFTDTASTSVNTIQAGTLDVTLEKQTGPDSWESVEGQTLDFVKAAGHESEAILWEPGCTYNLPTLRVGNNGNLALKYKIVISGINGDTKLNEAIDWTVTVDGQTFDIGTEQHLSATDYSEGFTISGHMQESAGNEYQGLTMDGVAITVYATQYTEEYDSNGNQYDKYAEYSGVDNGSTTISWDTTLNGTYIATTDNGNDPGDKNAIRVTGGNVTITGGYYDGGSGGSNAAVRADAGATVTIKDGYFTVGPDAAGGGNNVIYAAGGEITIEGGTFYTEYDYNGTFFTLNCNEKDGYMGTITVKGGKFYKFDPSANTTGEGVSVADGYKVVQNGDWYYVVSNDATTVSNASDLTAALVDGAKIALVGDIQLDGFINVNVAGTVNIALNGHKIVRTGVDTTAIYVNNAATTLNITGAGDVSGDQAAVWAAAGTVNIYGGTYTSLQAVYVQNTGVANIYGGTFKSENAEYGASFVLNQKDDSRTTSSINVYGGEFVNFNPANNVAEGTDTNFVASGYKVVETVSGSDTIYTVVAE